jgi:acyl-CoA reductase-like NAD-dependent aldehyde dehydrogenase
MPETGSMVLGVSVPPPRRTGTLQMFPSGYGKDLSMYALEDYTEVKHVMVSLS